MTVMVTFGLVLITALWWADALEDQARLRERCDVTPSLPVAICKPAAWRKR